MTTRPIQEGEEIFLPYGGTFRFAMPKADTEALRQTEKHKKAVEKLKAQLGAAYGFAAPAAAPAAAPSAPAASGVEELDDDDDPFDDPVAEESRKRATVTRVQAEV